MSTPLGRQIELGWRAFWIRVFTRLLRRAPSAVPDWRARPHRVLFLRHDRAGDMILSTGLLRAIASAQPSVELHVLASPANASIIERDPAVRRVIVFDKRRLLDYPRLVVALRRARYDAVIDCMVTSPSLTTLMLMAASGAPYRVGIADRGNDQAINLPVAGAPPGSHMAVRLGRLASAFGVDADATDWSPQLVLSAEERAWSKSEWRAAGVGARVLVNISAGTSDRRWADERFVALIRDIRSTAAHAAVLVMSAPDERARATRIARDGGAATAGTTTFREAMALVAASQVVVTSDTSIAHAAAAFKRVCVGLYSEDSVPYWRPFRTPGELVVYEGANIQAVETAPVIAAVNRAIGSLRDSEVRLAPTAEPR